MDYWKIKNGLVFLNKEENDIYLSAKELYGIQDTYIYENIEYNSPFEELNIRKSILSLNTILEFEYKNKEIFINLYAVKKAIKYKVPIVENHFADNIIIDNSWHYFNYKYDEYIEAINKSNVGINQKISLNTYMKLIRILKEENLEYIDNVTDKLETIKNNTDDVVIEGLNAKLFNYQSQGCKWLNFMVENKCGCILGDEMGLGKTLQIIAVLGSYKKNHNNSHFLVVCPVSLLENWKREIEKFFPTLTTKIHHGSRRTGLYTELLKYDVIIMSYTNVQTDLGILNMINWDIVVLDEAQNIKNPYANRSKTIKLLNKKMGIAVTGTPFENHMTDIWSIVDFVLPQYLGKISEYEEEFTDDVSSASQLEKLVTPIMLRRKVKDVAKDLPERIDIAQPIEMTYKEAMLYEDERSKNKIEALKNTSIDKIQGLRMFCTHPFVYDSNLENKDPTLYSNKYARMCEILREIFDNKDKVIIFTSFNKMIDIMVKDIKQRFGVYVNFINGSIYSEERQKVIDEFSNVNGPAVLILNPRAAGAGLNITAANHVIHYNLEWNPAIEDQASARSYRRGQNKVVFIYRLFYKNTIEEVIDDRIKFKRDISNAAVVGNRGNERDKEDLIRALSISPIGGNYENC